MSEIANIEIERYGKDAVVSSPCAVFSYQVSNEDPRTWNSNRNFAGFNYAYGASRMIVDGVEVPSTYDPTTRT